MSMIFLSKCWLFDIRTHQCWCTISWAGIVLDVHSWKYLTFFPSVRRFIHVKQVSNYFHLMFECKRMVGLQQQVLHQHIIFKQVFSGSVEATHFYVSCFVILLLENSQTQNGCKQGAVYRFLFTFQEFCDCEC